MKEITVMDLLRDEEKHLLDRLAYVRRLKSRIEREIHRYCDEQFGPQPG